MHAAWHHTHKASQDSQGRAQAGFHHNYIYKIVSQQDESVLFLGKDLSTLAVTLDTNEEDDKQRFRAQRVKEGEDGGEYELRCVYQNPGGPVQVLEFDPASNVLIQNASKEEGNQLWFTQEKEIDPVKSRAYFIKPVLHGRKDMCLTNMGIGHPLTLYRPAAPDCDTCQLWHLEVLDFDLA